MKPAFVPVAALIAVLGVGASSLSAPTRAAEAIQPTVALSSLAESPATPTTFVLDVDVAGASSAKLILDGRYIGEDTTVPLSFDINVRAGTHDLRVRAIVASADVRVDATIVASSSSTVPTTTSPPTTTPSAPTPAGSVALSSLKASPATPTSFVLAVDIAGASSAKLVIDGQYIGEDTTSPLTFNINVAAGAHDLRVRAKVGSVDVRVDARIVASSGGTAPTTTAPITPPTTQTPTTGGTIQVDTVEEIRAAFAASRPGDVIVVADGEYEFQPRLVAATDGTSSKPITVRGSRKAVIRTENASGDYGMHITGDYWRIEGISVAHATKGIVLDGSRGTVIDSVEVFDIGDEAIHFRKCSSDGVLRNSYIHDTGRNSAQYGEGVYVGSANSHWSNYQCADVLEGVTLGDNTERVLIENNVFEDITAEGADLKEGTDSGILRNNIFRRVGNSGQNSADSAVDAKGNNWHITGNRVEDSMASWDDHGVMRPSELLDGYQSHSVYVGYGTGNIFEGNVVLGAIPGFGIGMYPSLTNRVACDNQAPGAALGLVGDKSKPSTCTTL